MNYFLISLFCRTNEAFQFQTVKVATEQTLPSKQEIETALRKITPREYTSIHATAFSQFPDLDTYKNFDNKIL